MATLTTPKGAASVQTWMGTKAHISGQDIEAMVAQGYSKSQLAKLASSSDSVRFGPNALQALGVNKVYNYDPAQYNTAYAPFTAGKSSTVQGYSGRNLYSVTKTPYTFTGPAQPASAKPAAAPAPYAPVPLAGGGAGGAFNINMPAAPSSQFAPGGAGAVVDGNATGFRRKKSSARMAGLTSKGTSQFKISGQSAKSSGLNIGI